jgi:GNAT superfamily N-acetyltransferase
VKLEQHERRDAPGADRVRDGLLAWNAAAVDDSTRLPLVLLHRDDAGAVTAGLIGEVALRWCYIERLWVAAGCRGRGLGSALLAAAEAAAAARGALGVHLHSSSFQAPEFYRHRGYAELGRLDDRPPGHTRFWLAKRFAGRSRGLTGTGRDDGPATEPMA